ncbi:MAG TPA: hypothetical protein VJ924_17165, partial [Alphaproteobacteria bacterium]|nr:hypothetical protein [Alphaproteobacteria bacterium]
ALVALDDLAHLKEKAIEHEHDVVRRKRLRKRREVADVAKQHRDRFVFTAAPEMLFRQLTGDLEIGLVQDKAAQFHIAAQSRLASKANFGAKAECRGKRLFVFVPVHALLEALQDPDPACRAFRVPAASMGVGDAGPQRPLEDGFVRAHLELAFIGKAGDFRHLCIEHLVGGEPRHRWVLGFGRHNKRAFAPLFRKSHANASLTNVVGRPSASRLT